jgi:hypothetical protein
MNGLAWLGVWIAFDVWLALWCGPHWRDAFPREVDE